MFSILLLEYWNTGCVRVGCWVEGIFCAGTFPSERRVEKSKTGFQFHDLAVVPYNTFSEQMFYLSYLQRVILVVHGELPPLSQMDEDLQK